MINQTEQISLFKIIGSQLKRKVECLLIGGSTMMFYGAKNATKDIDIVFLKTDDLSVVKKIIYNSGFNERKKIKGIFREDKEIVMPIIMENNDRRFALFLNEVIGFKIHEKILERVKQVHEFGNFIVKTASPEDILMMKACTEREKDRDDGAELIKRFNIEWSIILSYASLQDKIGIAAFPLLLYDFLLELKENYKTEIPSQVMRELIKISEKKLKELSKKDDVVKAIK